jgi:hypothetical protein
MLSEEALQQRQTEMQVRSTIARSQANSKSKIGKIKPRTEQQQLATTRASILTLLKGKMAQAETDPRTFSWFLYAYTKLLKKQELPTFKEFFAYLPREEDENEPEIIQIRDPFAASPVPPDGAKTDGAAQV